jgi:DNA-directed RNA polymerase subunit RPC12/RpoP
MNRVCVVCGKEFETKSNKSKYCPECKEKGLHRIQNYTDAKTLKLMRAHLEAYKKSANALANINAKARELGLTYGQYQAKYGG